MQVASVHELEPFVLFLDGQPHEKRHLVNVPDLIPKLQQTFPGAPCAAGQRCGTSPRPYA